MVVDIEGVGRIREHLGVRDPAAGGLVADLDEKNLAELAEDAHSVLY